VITTWHRPLLYSAALMVGIAVVVLVLLFIDPREVTGMPLWAKPLKFALSIAIYCFTLSWLISLLTVAKRVAWIAGTLAAAGVVLEMVIIVGFAAVGDTSHFNVSTPLHTTLWGVMAFSITAVWIMTLIVGIALFRSRLGDRARSVGIRAGVIISLVGMALAFLMTGPTAQQLDDFQGIAGAHTVGLADGGAGIPLLGWSTESGDLRIPHFIGMHALQVLPLVVIGLELLARRWPRLDAGRRLRLIWIATGAYAAIVGLVTVQALAGESIVQPSGQTLLAGSIIAVLAAGGALAALRSHRQGQSLTPESAAR
jgi:hypothetical protein